MKKVSLKMWMAGFLVLMLALMTACSSAGNTNTNEPSKGAADEGAKKAEPITFKMGHMNSPDHVQDSMVMTPFSKEVDKATDSRVKFQLYPGGALGGPKDTYDNILTGIMDAGWGLQGYNAGKFPVHSVLQLPFLADGTGEQLSVVAQTLYNEFPEIQAEYKDVKVLWVHAADPYAIITSKKAVKSFADVKGLKLRAPSVEAKSMIESWGATPVSLPAPEIYDALQKGVIDGGVLPVAAIKDFNLVDAIKYVTIGNFNTSLFYELMNKDSWNKISAEDQKTIDGMIGMPMAKQAGTAFDYQKEQAEKASKDGGVEFITLPTDELQKFKDASKVVTDKWISDMTAKGIPAQKIYDRTVELIKAK